MRRVLLSCLLDLLFLAAASAVRAQDLSRRHSLDRPGRPKAEDPEVREMLDKYIGLYARESLDEWRALFLPAFVAGFTHDDGSVTTRTLDEFFERQKTYFATGRPIREELANVRVDRTGSLVSGR